MGFDGMAIIKFLEIIGWGEWAKEFLVDGDYSKITFPELVFGTLPFMLQLFLVIFLLNWIMGLIGDIAKRIAGGGRL